MSADWIAVLVFSGVGLLALDADGWENVLMLAGLVFVCGFLVWMMAP